MLDKLKRRLGITDASQDALLTDLLDEAQAYVKVYTGRADIPALLEPAVVWLAAAAFNELGLEGERSHSEGAVSQSIELLPARMRSLLDMQRVGKVGSP